jgi:hypothetical protein
MTRVLALVGQSKIGCITQRRFAKAGTKTHPQRGAALDRNGLSVSTETSCRFEPKSPVGNSEICSELDDRLKNLDASGMFVRSFDAQTGEIDDEPETGRETVLTVNLSVGSDLERNWTLISQRAQAQGLTRNLSWGDRVRLAPTRIGMMADYHLGWSRGSVLNRVSEERADASAVAGEGRARRLPPSPPRLSERVGSLPKRDKLGWGSTRRISGRRGR